MVAVPIATHDDADDDDDGAGDITPRRRRQPDTWDGYIYDDTPRYTGNRRIISTQPTERLRMSSPALVEEEVTGLGSSVSLSTGKARRRHHEGFHEGHHETHQVGSTKALQSLIDDIPTIAKLRSHPLYIPSDIQHTDNSSPHIAINSQLGSTIIKSDLNQAPDSITNSQILIDKASTNSISSSVIIPPRLDFSIIEQQPRTTNDIDSSTIPSTTPSSSTPNYRPQSRTSNPWTNVSSIPRGAAADDDLENDLDVPTPSTMSPFTMASSLSGSPTGSYAHMSPPFYVPDLPSNDPGHIQPMALPGPVLRQVSWSMTEDSWTDGDVASEFR